MDPSSHTIVFDSTLLSIMFLCQTILAQDSVDIVYISTDEITADILTKSLGRIKFELHRDSLGIRDSND